MRACGEPQLSERFSWMSPSRRTFLSTAAAATGGLAVACADRTVGVPVLSRLAGSLPLDPQTCGIEHIVVLMMENRSFDHFLGRAVPQRTSFDRYFCASLGPTFPNRISQHAGQTDRLSNTPALSTLPTIWDRLAARGLRGRYYYGDVPFLGLWGAKYVPISRPLDEFFADCRAGSLPHVAFVDGPFLTEATGTGPDDHPFSDIRAGDAFMNRIYAAVTASPAWEHTVLVINFDEWGGFFDHVPPPAAPIPEATRAAGDADGLRGFHPHPARFAVRAPPTHVARGVRPHVGVADDRVALESPAAYRPGPDGEQSRTGVGLQSAAARRVRILRARRDRGGVPGEPGLRG